MCPIVPIFKCGFVRSTFSFAIAVSAPQLVRSLTSRWNFPLALLPGRPAGRFRDHFLGDRSGGLGIMREMHGKTCPSLGAPAAAGGIPEHPGKRHFDTNHIRAAARFGSLNLAPPRIQVPEHL